LIFIDLPIINNYSLSMTSNFVTFYLIIVLITGPFFQFLPMPESLKWDEILLAKILNQAPMIFLLGFLIFQVKKIKNKVIYVLLIAFVTTSILSETYYYFISPENCFTAVVLNNIISYCIIIAVLLKKIKSFKATQNKTLCFAIGISTLILFGFSFSTYNIIKDYFIEKPFDCIILLTFIFAAITIVFLSVLAHEPFKRLWFETIIGILGIVIVDVYTYNCLFVFNTEPILIFTVGKIFFSLGVLLFVDSTLRKPIINGSHQSQYSF
jgi:hypothetical protein